MTTQLTNTLSQSYYDIGLSADLTYGLDDFKTHPSDEFYWHFARGVFESYGFFNDKINYSLVTITLTNNVLFDLIKNCGIYNTTIKVSESPYGYIINFTNTNAFDFIDKIYRNIKNDFITPPKCLFVKSNKAVTPSKNYASDEGYDLTIINVNKVISKNTIRYDTGIKVQPHYGYYFEIIPRSSLSNYGVILANSVGIIDSSYRGNLMVVLTKVDNECKDIELPFKGFQLILRKCSHYELEETNENGLLSTARNIGGFGSTGK